MKFVSTLVIVIILSFQAQATTDFCSDPKLGSLPILSDGRIKPLVSHAGELRKKVFSQTCGLPPVELFCRLSTGEVENFQRQSKCQITFKVDHEKAMKLLGVATHEVSWEIVEKNNFALTEEYKNEEMQGRKDGGYALTLARLMTSLSTFKEIVSGQNWKILVENNKWVGLDQIPIEQREKVIQEQNQYLGKDDQKRIDYEIIFQKTNPFSHGIWIGIIVFLISLAAVRMSSAFKVAIGSGVVFLVVQIYGIILRVLISGRSPVTNMYETVMWVGLGVLGLGLLMGVTKKDAKLLSIAVGANVIALFMMKFATTMLDESIRPLVPVLRDNFWLSTHVTTITLSYACFALSWVLSNVGLFGVLFGRIQKQNIERMNDAIRMGMQVGSVLLAAGIILGGVWADYSWGRFWGWDPKETWSLIALMVYMMILHGRYAGWFKGFTFTILGAAGFMFVLMAWFGVNYILASGLHSYGFSSGGAAFLLTIFLSQICIIAASAIRGRHLV
ncbi:MAG: hypothetical protein BroJett040_11660 [Oligoflexia bacterium]|nr:MAG: hypothetical protein BroJett040_11660 [Oligoflexia bacterium]